MDTVNPNLFLHEPFNHLTLDTMSVYLGHEWTLRLKNTLISEEFDKLYDFLENERRYFTIYPSTNAEIFRAFTLTPFQYVRIVIIGQDPYHDGSADGLAFSNRHSTTPSPSLRSIFDELEREYPQNNPWRHAKPVLDLERWAKQGVLLLNTALTVRKSQPNSHAIQWEFFTQAVLNALNTGHSGLVYMLWGEKAKSFKPYINDRVHHVIEAAHPASVVYGNKSWINNGCFLKANQTLMSMNNIEIDWLHDPNSPPIWG